MSEERYEINDPAVVADEIDGMAVIINLDSGAYYSGTDSAAQAWNAVVAGATAPELAAALSLPTAAVSAFVGYLQDEQLLRPRTCEPQAWAADACRGPLTLERFDDLQDLLLLDPVHDVNRQGWPHREA